MSKTVYGARFFIEHYYPRDGGVLRRTKEELRRRKKRYVSAMVPQRSSLPYA